MTNDLLNIPSWNDNESVFIRTSMKFYINNLNMDLSDVLLYFSGGAFGHENYYRVRSEYNNYSEKIPLTSIGDHRQKVMNFFTGLGVYSPGEYFTFESKIINIFESFWEVKSERFIRDYQYEKTLTFYLKKPLDAPIGNKVELKVVFFGKKVNEAIIPYLQHKLGPRVTDAIKYLQELFMDVGLNETTYEEYLENKTNHLLSLPPEELLKDVQDSAERHKQEAVKKIMVCNHLPVKWSPGGTYCYFHKKELCSVMPKHCTKCGENI